MPQLIEHIDAIARRKQRDVLFLEFLGNEIDSPRSRWNWGASVGRQTVINWLKANQIRCQSCGDIAETNSMTPHAGQIYIDVPYDETDSVYQKVLRYLETPDGSSRLPGVRLFVLKLHIAMENVHHDEPGFWDRWAEHLF